MADEDAYGIARDLSLDAGEAVVLVAMQVAMMQADLEAERSAKTLRIKIAARDEFVSAAAERLTALTSEVPPWATEFLGSLDSRTPELKRANLASAPKSLGMEVASRARALLLLIELFTFDPWPTKTSWVAKARKQSLAEQTGFLTALKSEDCAAVESEFVALIRRLRRKSIKWHRVALVSVVGLGVGALTAGWAAPMIGAAIGSAAGLTGAAATSAGLATLGGGSIAAGGFGVAGGTALLTGLGGFTGAGAAVAAGTGFESRRSGQIVIDAIKLDLVTRLVIIDADGDNEKAKRVVESLQVRLVEVAAMANQLAEQIRVLSDKNTKLTAENRDLRARLREEHSQAQMAEATLEVVLERLPGGA